MDSSPEIVKRTMAMRTLVILLFRPDVPMTSTTAHYWAYVKEAKRMLPPTLNRIVLVVCPPYQDSPTDPVAEYLLRNTTGAVLKDMYHWRKVTLVWLFQLLHEATTTSIASGYWRRFRQSLDLYPSPSHFSYAVSIMY